MNPKIDQRAVCISGNPLLSAMISSYFNKNEEYFSIFHFPEIKTALELKDSLMSKIVVERAKIFITNRILQLKPNRVILAGLNNFEKEFFNDLPKAVVLVIDDVSEVDKMLGDYNSFSGIFECCQDDVLMGLFMAKIQNKKLVINEKVLKLPDRQIQKSDGLVVMEKDLDVSGIIAVNYAISVAASLIIVPERRKSDVDCIKDYFIKDKNLEIEPFDNLIKDIKRIFDGINFNNYKWVSFFTIGIPYGYFLGNTVPMSYILNMLPDYFIFDNIFIEEKQKHFYSFINFSIFENDESDLVIDEFRTNNYFVTNLKDKSATKCNFKNFIQHFPYDLLHIGSHGGGLEGFYVQRKFKDRNGSEHKLEYYEVDDFELVDELDKKGERMVGITSKIIFEKLDGYKWMTEECHKNIPQYVFEDMNRIMEVEDIKKTEENEVVRVLHKGQILSSGHVMCIDNIHQCNFHYLAGQTAPIIFNNSCDSWYEIGYSLLGSGARLYIGTLWGIEMETAKSSAEFFYKAAFQGNTLLDIIFRMNKNIDRPKYKEIYILWGLHFSKLAKNNQTLTKIKSKIIQFLVDLFVDINEKIFRKDSHPDVIKNSKEISKFIFLTLDNLGAIDKEKLHKLFKISRDS